MPDQVMLRKIRASRDRGYLVFSPRPFAAHSHRSNGLPDRRRTAAASAGRIEGVGRLEFNLVQRRLRVEHSLGDSQPILAAVRAVGMGPVVEQAGDQSGTAAGTVFRIENMDCPTEEALIRSKLSGLPQVEQLDFQVRAPG